MIKTRHRRGFTLTELIVSATLLMATVAMIAPTSFRNGRLWIDVRQRTVAIDEMTNQVEYLIALDDDAREAAIAELQVSPHAASVLRNATFTAEEKVDENGRRIELSLNWDRLGDPDPIVLVGWIDPLANRQGGAQ